VKHKASFFPIPNYGFRHGFKTAFLSHNMGLYNDKLDCETALTFDDVLLRPSESGVEPNEADVRTRVSRNLELNVPVVSAAMDTVTEASMATAMARNGGLGVVHRNMSTESQKAEIRKVKEADRLVTREVVTVSPDETVDDAVNLMERESVSGLPVVEEKQRSRRENSSASSATVTYARCSTKEKRASAM
jgi:IMP dehydrogenase/GMP reductase